MISFRVSLSTISNYKNYQNLNLLENVDALQLQESSLVFFWSYALDLVSLSCWFNKNCWHLMFTLQLLKERMPATNAFHIRADMASSVCCFNSLRARVIKASDTESIPSLPLKGRTAVSM